MIVCVELLLLLHELLDIFLLVSYLFLEHLLLCRWQSFDLCQVKDAQLFLIEGYSLLHVFDFIFHNAFLRVQNEELTFAREADEEGGTMVSMAEEHLMFRNVYIISDIDNFFEILHAYVQIFKAFDCQKEGTL